MTTPTVWTPKVLFEGALSTTLTTTLVTAPASTPVHIVSMIITNTGATTRAITIDYFKATSRKILSAHGLPPGTSVDVLGLLGMSDGMIIDAGDLIRGGQDVGTDVDCIITGIEMS